ncbi:MAG: hypothetical protein KDJ38_14245 [Gammaproteobacteria bacterium]|nr:hypothetical protein [Gammaproteobacteria bacterium]
MLKKWLVGSFRQLRLFGVFFLVLMVAGGVFSYLSTALQFSSTAEDIDMSETVEPEQAWGEGIVANVVGHVSAGLPIRVANACGLGASSCFRCHNGKRAEAPATDPDKNPWHVQHSSVNNSCAGCHKGNPRLMKKEMSHRELIVNSVAEPEQACFGCHTGDDGPALVDKYLQVTQ